MTEIEEGKWPRLAGGTMEMEEGRRLHSSAVEMPTGRHSNVVEKAEAARRSTVMALQNGSVRLLKAFWRTKACECWRGYDCWAVELVSRPANESVQTIRHPQHNISEKFNKLFQ